MLLAIDIGNTNIVLGIFDGEILTESWRLSTLRERTADELWVLVSRLFEDRGLDTKQVSGVVLSSVVPPLTASRASPTTSTSTTVVTNPPTFTKPVAAP